MRSRLPGRVMLTCDSVGGVWQYATTLAAGLSRQGVSVMLAVVGPEPDAAQRAAARDAGVAEIRATGLELDWTACSRATVIAASERLAQLATVRSVDLVHLHAPAFARGGLWPAPVVVTVHSCAATWWRATRGGPIPADFRWRRQLAAEGLRSADARVAPTAAFAAQVRAEYGDDIDIRVVWNGRTPRPVAPVRRRHGIVSAGRLWDEAKNLRVLALAARGLPVPVRLAGSPRGPNGETADLQDVEVLGVLDEQALWRLYAEAAIYAAPALYEPFGLAVLEAAQAGLALVLSDIPTFRELWDGAALFVDAGDAEAWRAALGGLAADAAARDALAGAARRRSQRYAADAMAIATTRIYRLAMAADRMAEAV